jgi:hypothetical protein
MNFKLRLAILGPTLAAILALAILGFALPHLMQPLTLAMILVLAAGTSINFFLNRSRNRKNG